MLWCYQALLDQRLKSNIKIKIVSASLIKEFPLSKFGYCALLENFRRSSKTVQDDYLDVKNEVVWCDCKFWKAQDQSGRKFSFDLSKDLSDKSEKINNIISDKIRRKKAQQPESDGRESLTNCPSFSFYNFHWCVGLHQQQVPTTHIKLWKWPNRSKHWINSEYKSYACFRHWIVIIKKKTIWKCIWSLSAVKNTFQRLYLLFENICYSSPLLCYFWGSVKFFLELALKTLNFSGKIGAGQLLILCNSCRHG